MNSPFDLNLLSHTPNRYETSPHYPVRKASLGSHFSGKLLKLARSAVAKRVAKLSGLISSGGQTRSAVKT